MPARSAAAVSRSIPVNQLDGNVSSGTTLNAPSAEKLRDRRIAYVCAQWTGGANMASIPVVATYAGQAMTLVGSLQYTDTNKSVHGVWKLEDAPADPKPYVVTYGPGIPNTILPKNLLTAAVLVEGVDEVGTPVQASGGSATTTNRVTVPITDGKPAWGVLSFHSVNGGKNFSAFTGSQLAKPSLRNGGTLLVGLTPGAASVVPTATQSSTTDWACTAIPMSASPVDFGAELTVDIRTSASAKTHRKVWPAPDRTYLIDGGLVLERQNIRVGPHGLTGGVGPAGPADDAVLLSLAASPDQIAVGSITRSSTGAATNFAVSWPDGATGVFNGTESLTVPGAIDSYTVTHVIGSDTTTFTQPTLTRNSSGAVTNRPALEVT